MQSSHSFKFWVKEKIIIFLRLKIYVFLLSATKFKHWKPNFLLNVVEITKPRKAMTLNIPKFIKSQKQPN